MPALIFLIMAIAQMSLCTGMSGKIGGAEFRVQNGLQIIQPKPSSVQKIFNSGNNRNASTSTIFRAWRSLSPTQVLAWNNFKYNKLHGRALFTQINTNRLILGNGLIFTPPSLDPNQFNGIASFGWNYGTSQWTLRLLNPLNGISRLAVWLSYPMPPGQKKSHLRYALVFTGGIGSTTQVQLNPAILSNFGVVANPSMHFACRVKLISYTHFFTQYIFHIIDNS
jgi:hypothetical protein